MARAFWNSTRVGDPETQVYLTRLENDLVELLGPSVSGTLDKIELKWKPRRACACDASGVILEIMKRKTDSRLDNAAKLRTKSFSRRHGAQWKLKSSRMAACSRRDGFGQD